MNLKKLLLLVGTTMFFSVGINAQTTLSQGDLWFLCMNGHGSPDEFTFVTLVDIDAGTEIFFTDEERGAAGDSTHPAPGFNSAIIKYTAPAGGLAAGTVVFWQTTAGTADFEVDTAGTGSGDITFGNNGDKIIAYQGTAWDEVTTYLAAMGNSASYGSFPAYFTNAFNLGAVQDVDYRGPRGSTIADLQSLFADITNFLQNSGGSQIPVVDINVDPFEIGYFWDGSAWSPSDPSGNTGLTDNIYAAAPGAVITGTTTTTGNVVVRDTGTLSATGTLTAATMVVSSSAEGQGQATGSVVATTEFQSYVSSATARWFNVGSPVDGALSTMQFTNGGLVRTLADVGTASDVNIYSYDPNTLNGGTSEGTWVAPADQTPASDANGWSIYLGGGATFGTLPMTISTFGTLNNGTVNTTISTSNGGWNFVNNPYATSVDFDEVVTDNSNISATYYIRDDEAGAWISYSAPAGVPAGRRYIGPGQAVFVNAGTATNLEFNTSQQTMTEAVSIARSQPNPAVYLEVSTLLGAKDYTYVGFQTGLTDARDLRMDGVKRMNDGPNVPSLYSSLQGEDYVFKFIDDQFTTRTVPVSFDHSIDEDLTITGELRGLDATWTVMLEDKLENKMHDLRTGPYTFSHVSGNDADRFVIHFSRGSVSLDENGTESNSIFAYSENNNIMVNLEGITNEEVSLQVYDMSGKMLVNKVANGSEVAEIAVPSSVNGVYLLKVVSEGTMLHSQKIMK